MSLCYHLCGSQNLNYGEILHVKLGSVAFTIRTVLPFYYHAYHQKHLPPVSVLQHIEVKTLFCLNLKESIPLCLCNIKKQIFYDHY
jgi:hypothetical protein